MFDFDKITLYKQYLNTIQKTLDGFFEEQKEYICCKKGCAHCCERGTYPYTRVETDYLLLGLFKLEKEKQQGVINRIKKLKEEYKNCEDKENFMHRCPFLGDDNICTVYEFRGLICRTFGLLTTRDNKNISMPFCQELGLNYSKIYDSKTKTFDPELIKKHGYKNVPKTYDLRFKTLMSEDIFVDKKIEFGEIKALIEWL